MAEPTIEQLANFAVFEMERKTGTKHDKQLVLELLTDSEELRAGWLENHRRFQAAIDEHGTIRKRANFGD